MISNTQLSYSVAQQFSALQFATYSLWHSFKINEKMSDADMATKELSQKYQNSFLQVANIRCN